MSRRYGDETRIRGSTQNFQIGWKLSNCGQFRQLVLKFGQIRQIERILKAICNASLELLMCFLVVQNSLVGELECARSPPSRGVGGLVLAWPILRSPCTLQTAATFSRYFNNNFHQHSADTDRKKWSES